MSQDIVPSDPTMTPERAVAVVLVELSKRVRDHEGVLTMHHNLIQSVHDTIVDLVQDLANKGFVNASDYLADEVREIGVDSFLR